MQHKIDLEKYNIRTDLALEAIAPYKSESGIKSTIELQDDVNITTVILDDVGGSKIKKKAGTYITMEFNDVTDYNNQQRVMKVFQKQLTNMIKKIKLNKDCLVFVVGLGNEKSTADSLGPLVVNKLVVTNHLYILNQLGTGFSRVCALEPGVMGTTGIETSDLIYSAVKEIKPDLLIVVDALASQSVDRLNKTIQMTDTGIHPGSGIGNYRKEISSEVMGIPVIAIGVPTVVDAVTIVSDTINYMHKHFSYNKKNINNPINKLIPITKVNYLKKSYEIKPQDKETLLGMVGSLSDTDLRQLIFEVLSPIGYNLMVTPKEVDYVMLKLSEVISDGINGALHKNIKH